MGSVYGARNGCVQIKLWKLERVKSVNRQEFDIEVISVSSLQALTIVNIQHYIFQLCFVFYCA